VFHRHVWKVIEKMEQRSGLEIVAQTKILDVDGPLDFHALTTRPVLVTFRCSCGAEAVKRV
jgi:hypothetical protein